jgi:hypothetical protein
MVEQHGERDGTHISAVTFDLAAATLSAGVTKRQVP